MIRAWRIVRNKRLPDAFTGEGARLGGGRWNHTGTPLVYVSATLSLAALEIFVNLMRNDITLAKSLLAIPVEIPDPIKITEVSVKELKPGWRVSPPRSSTKDIGSEWIRKGISPVLRVPSAVIPSEYNYALNPKHHDFAKIKIGKPQPFTLDERMWK